MKWFAFLAVYIFSCTHGSSIFYVLPDNSTSSSCPFQPCAKLSEYLNDDFDLMFVLSDLEFHFLPGEYQVTEIFIEYVYNFSFHGIVGDSLPPVVLKFHSNVSEPISLLLEVKM